MSPKEICDVISNNTCYYKEVFDVYGFMCKKVRAYHKSKAQQKAVSSPKKGGGNKTPYKTRM